jgi:DNA replication protein DnaC
MDEIEEIQQLRYELMLRESNISKREINTLYKCETKAINAVIHNPTKFVENGDSMFIWSHMTGVGKTISACAILKAYAKELSKSNVYGHAPIYFMNMPQFFNELRRDIDRSEKITPEQIIWMKEAALCVFDEIAIKPLTQYEKDSLYEIIDYRVREMKASIFTSNMSPNEKARMGREEMTLEDMLGKQLYSRMFTASSCIELTGEDRR